MLGRGTIAWTKVQAWTLAHESEPPDHRKKSAGSPQFAGFLVIGAPS
jgi:hypothetical protein